MRRMTSRCVAPGNVGMVGLIGLTYYNSADAVAHSAGPNPMHSPSCNRLILMHQRAAALFRALVFIAVAYGISMWRLQLALAAPPDAASPKSENSDGGGASQPPTPDVVHQWIKELAHDDFGVRQRAFQQLLAAGMAAREPLLAIADGPDPETRASARRLVTLIDRSEFQRRLDAFAADTDGKQKLTLPGWEQFQKLAGSSPADRALFVEMQRHEGSLLSSVFGVSRQAPEDLWESRLQRIVLWQSTMGDRASTPPLGSCATMLFLAARKELTVSDAAVINIDSLLQRSPVKDVIMRDGGSEALRRLVLSWVMSCPNNSEMALSCRLKAIAMADLKEGLPLALAIASGEPDYSRATPLTRASAALLVGQMGTRRHLDQLQALLEDATACFGTMGLVQGGATVQVRDAALIAMLQLTEQSPSDYGYVAARLQAPRSFDIQSLYRQNDEQRVAAIAKWRAWRAANKDK